MYYFLTLERNLDGQCNPNALEQAGWHACVASSACLGLLLCFHWTRANHFPFLWVRLQQPQWVYQFYTTISLGPSTTSQSNLPYLFSGAYTHQLFNCSSTASYSNLGGIVCDFYGIYNLPIRTLNFLVGSWSLSQDQFRIPHILVIKVYDGSLHFSDA